jgi:hypothetical protein
LPDEPFSHGEVQVYGYDPADLVRGLEEFLAQPDVHDVAAFKENLTRFLASHIHENYDANGVLDDAVRQTHALARVAIDVIRTRLASEPAGQVVAPDRQVDQAAACHHVETEVRCTI